MHAAELANWRSTPLFSSSAVWSSAFEWIETRAATAEAGVHYDFPDKSMFVRVMAYELKDRSEARYENHRSTIDLQYTIAGAEGIEYTPSRMLVPDGEYDRDKDFQFFQTPSRPHGRIDNHAGHFCILWPSDGHMPQLRVEGFSEVRKLVVKIPLSLVAGA
jgi:YhcH/YjgK/YiaL family protein